MFSANLHLTGATENDLERLEAYRHNLQSRADRGLMTQADAVRAMMACAFSVGRDRGLADEPEEV